MIVIYRLRGLLGDATEHFVSTLADNDEHGQIDSIASPMINALAECGGVSKALRWVRDDEICGEIPPTWC